MRTREGARRRTKPALTSDDISVSGATPTPICIRRERLANLLFVARSGGTQGREAGRPAPAKPHQNTSTEVARVRATAASDRLGDSGLCGGGRSEERRV